MWPPEQLDPSAKQWSLQARDLALGGRWRRHGPWRPINEHTAELVAQTVATLADGMSWRLQWAADDRTVVLGRTDEHASQVGTGVAVDEGQPTRLGKDATCVTPKNHADGSAAARRASRPALAPRSPRSGLDVAVVEPENTMVPTGSTDPLQQVIFLFHMMDRDKRDFAERLGQLHAAQLAQQREFAQQNAELQARIFAMVTTVKREDNAAQLALERERAAALRAEREDSTAELLERLSELIDANEEAAEAAAAVERNPTALEGLSQLLGAVLQSPVGSALAKQLEAANFGGPQQNGSHT